MDWKMEIEVHLESSALSKYFGKSTKAQTPMAINKAIQIIIRVT